MPVNYGSVGGAVGVDDVYVNVLPPQPQIAAQGATLKGAVVGGASWGPIGIPLNNSSASDLTSNYGLPVAGNVCPMVQEGAVFLKQQPQGGLVTVRVADGTQLAAAGYIGPSSGSSKIVFTGLYTGTLGNTLKVTIAAGTFPSTLKALVYLGTSIAEVYDGIPATGSVAALISRMNQASSKGPASNYVIASAGSGSAELVAGDTVTLAGGVDGFTGITTSMLIGTTTGTMRTGMQALTKQGMDVFWLAGCTDSTAWPSMLSFALQESAMAVGNFPLGTTVTNAIASVQSAAVVSPWFSVMLGFAVYLDTYLGYPVYIPQAGVLAGVCCSLEPHISPGNKQVYGLLGTDRTYGPLAQDFSETDETSLETAGICFISGTIPAANALGIRHGKNSSNNIATNEIAYTRKTNDIVRALKGSVMGQFVDLPQGTAANDEWRENVRSAGNGYFGPQVGSEIDSYTWTCDLTNNSPATIAQGIGRADALVKYLANVNRFIINVTGGQSVDISVQSSTSTAV
jgi:hypothetical protein